MNETKYGIALSQLEYVLNHTEYDLTSKIPNTFIQFIRENKDEDYIVNFDENLPIEKLELLPETEAFISLIFRKYWATEEEKKELYVKDKIEYQENEILKNKLYNIDFEKRKKYKEILVEEKRSFEKSLIKYKENIFIRLWNKLKNIFKDRI